MESLGTSITRAFKWHWNLLAVGGGVAFALVSGRPEFVLPIVAAGEIAYLGFLGTNARFQNVLRGKGLLEADAEESEQRTEEKLRSLLSFVSPEDGESFYALRDRCAGLTHLQNKMAAAGDKGSQKFRAESLDKLLWLHLKLLHHKAGISRFLVATDRDKLARDLLKTEADLEKAKAANRTHRLTGSIGEKLATLKDRLTNYDEATENWEIVHAEIEKSEQKINHICEVGMTSRDPSALSHQIDGISDSISTAEHALSGLDLDGIVSDVEEVPAFVSGIERRQSE